MSLATASATTRTTAPRRTRIAVFIPCLNEALTIAKVIQDFQRELPEAEIWVVDNGSTDDTAEIAAQNGANVIHESRRGKGFAVRTAFRRIPADMFIMVDGDDTYPAEAIHDLLQPALAGRADMVVGSRMQGSDSQFHLLNRLGNRMYRGLMRFLLRVRLSDILSGYRVMTREFVRTIPIAAAGFEIEAELTAKAVERSQRIVEVPVNLRHRREGSFSKIRMVGDGFRIAWTILLLFRDYKPMTFFGGTGLILMALGLLLGIDVAIDFFETGLVLRLPTAVLAAALEIAGILLIGIGFVLSAVSRRFQEIETKLDMLANGSDNR